VKPSGPVHGVDASATTRVIGEVRTSLVTSAGSCIGTIVPPRM
jgi:hypothetical protein